MTTDDGRRTRNGLVTNPRSVRTRQESPGAFPERQARQWLLGIPRVLLASNCCTSTNCKIRHGRTPRHAGTPGQQSISCGGMIWYLLLSPVPPFLVAHCRAREASLRYAASVKASKHPR